MAKVKVDFNESLNDKVIKVKEIEEIELPKKDEILSFDGEDYRVTLVHEFPEPTKVKGVDYVVELEQV